MDYGELLCKAQQINKSSANKEVRCYKTVFAPPKKMERSNVSSENIKKFLARKEAEEKRKREQASRRKEELLALRSQDKKAQKRVQVMLRSTKSANKSVMEDAIDNVNKTIALSGFNQCDEDDYGYVSQEATAFYNNLIKKYETMPKAPSIFSKPRKEVKDFNLAKDRVKLALRKGAEEELMPHKIKERKLDYNSTDVEEQDNEADIEDEIKPEKPETKLKRKISGTPPLKFEELLRMAEKKQYEPILIDERKLKKEPERLMTEKEKMEHENVKELRKLNKKKNPNGISTNDVKDLENENKYIKTLKQKEKYNKENLQKKGAKCASELLVKKFIVTDQSIKKELDNKDVKQKLDTYKTLTSNKENRNIKSQHKTQDKQKVDNLNKPKQMQNTNIEKRKLKPVLKWNSDSKTVERVKNRKAKYLPHREKELSDIYKQLELLKLQKEMQIENARLEKMLLMKMKYICKSKKISQQKKKPALNIRIGSESDEENPELEDFIDDSPVKEEVDYSKYISEIFGYDKSKYVNQDDNGSCMKSNFAQLSTKTGSMEDLEVLERGNKNSKKIIHPILNE